MNYVSAIGTTPRFTVLVRTMYCVRDNFQFGICRVMDSVRPYDKKLGPDTWYYTKRCFLALIEKLAMHLILLRDAVRVECIKFLDDCESKTVTHHLYTVPLTPDVAIRVQLLASCARPG